MNIDFHTRCDNRGATITLFKTDEGRICGGYTSRSWESPVKEKGFFAKLIGKKDEPSAYYVKDRYAFLFSVDHQQKFYIVDDNASKAILCGSKYGPYFG